MLQVLKTPLGKGIAVLLVLTVLGILVLSHGGKSKPTSQANSQSHTDTVDDGVTADNAVETLRTLTAKVNQLSQQNAHLAQTNAALQKANHAHMQSLMDKFNAFLKQHPLTQTEKKKQAPQAAHPPQESHDVVRSKFGLSGKALQQGSPRSALVVIPDMAVQVLGSETTDPSSDDHPSPDPMLSDLGFHDPQANDHNTTAHNVSAQSHKNVENPFPLADPASQASSQSGSNVAPYATIPPGATLTGAKLMQPLIARVPINGKVPNPYPFKVIVGKANLTANGVDLPNGISGMIAQGYSEGDMLGHCARGYITLVTFVFQDGRIATQKSDDNTPLGTLSAANGNPCLPGTFHTNAPEYLGGTAVLGGVAGFANALSANQTYSVTNSDASVSTVVNNANTYAAGQAISGMAGAAQSWWDERNRDAFDYVYVPNVDGTGAIRTVVININQAIPIDDDSTKRKVFYAKKASNSTAIPLD